MRKADPQILHDINSMQASLKSLTSKVQANIEGMFASMSKEQAELFAKAMKDQNIHKAANDAVEKIINMNKK